MLSLKAAAAPNLFLQSVYFALGEREHEITQLKCSFILERTDQCTDDTGSSDNFPVLGISRSIVDLLKLSSHLFGFRVCGGWSASIADGEQGACRYYKLAVRDCSSRSAASSLSVELLLEGKPRALKRTDDEIGSILNMRRRLYDKHRAMPLAGAERGRRHRGEEVEPARINRALRASWARGGHGQFKFS